MSALAALLLLTSPAEGAVSAERAFAAAAQTDGQWTAFRAFAADDAVMFVPRETNAQDFLDGLEDPAIAVMWWPAESYISCDGTIAVNSGPWVRPRSRGYFTTVWQRQEDGSWRWLLDHGDGLADPHPAGEEPSVRRAACPDAPLAVEEVPAPEGAVDYGHHHSPDGTLIWSWQVREGGARRVEAFLYNGAGYDHVITNDIAGRTP